MLCNTLLHDFFKTDMETFTMLLLIMPQTVCSALFTIILIFMHLVTASAYSVTIIFSSLLYCSLSLLFSSETKIWKHRREDETKNKIGIVFSKEFLPQVNEA